MEVLIWVLAIFAVIVVVVIYVITSVKKYSDTFVGKYIDKDTKDKKDTNDPPPPTRGGNF